MNRRKFLTYLGGGTTLLLGAGQVVKEGALNTESVNKAPKLTHTWEPGHKEKHYMFVVKADRPGTAERIYNLMGRPRNVKVCSPGHAICGYGADVICIDDGAMKADSPHLQYTYDSWYREALHTRLMPGGRFTKAYWEAHSFNFDQECGVQASIDTFSRGARVMKRKRDLIPEDWCMAKADIFRAFIRSDKSRDILTSWWNSKKETAQWLRSGT